MHGDDRVKRQISDARADAASAASAASSADAGSGVPESAGTAGAWAAPAAPTGGPGSTDGPQTGSTDAAHGPQAGAPGSAGGQGSAGATAWSATAGAGTTDATDATGAPGAGEPDTARRGNRWGRRGVGKQRKRARYGRRRTWRGPIAALSTSVSLRFLILTLIILISGAGLFGSSIAVSQIMRDAVYGRVDEELHDSLGGWANNAEIFHAGGAGARPPSEYVVIKIFQDGSMVTYNEAGGGPDLGQVRLGVGIQTVGSDPDTGDQVRWRTITDSQQGVTTVVAKSLASEDSIMANLNNIQGLISLVALAMMGGLGYVMTTRALRPLSEVKETANAIAAGDHGRRLPKWNTDTEVGQLARSLNTMLERLQASIRESQAKEEQMRRFVGDASHELRTPLTSVRGYAELYRSGAVGDVDMVLGKIDEESKRMSLLVEDLLALTRAEGQKLEMKPVDMLELCLSVAGSARAAFPERRIGVDNRVDEVPMVEGDKDRLHQCLLNLVTNGLRHGGDDAEVTLRLREDGPGHLLVQVADDGRGMSAEDAAHIFERFYRADTSRSRASGGSGLGLAITKSLVEKHGGSISVESEQGVGSVFTIRLARLPE